jgi:hypothetical protein
LAKQSPPARQALRLAQDAAGLPTAVATPRSYRPGALVERLAHDLPGYEVARTGPLSVRCRPPGDCPPFDAVEVTERHALMGLTTVTFSCRLGGAPGSSRLRVRRTGAWRRRGVSVRPDGGSGAALLADRGFVEAIMPLDFRWFDVVRDRAGWSASTELTGPPKAATRLAAAGTYLPADQRLALEGTFTALARVVRTI